MWEAVGTLVLVHTEYDSESTRLIMTSRGTCAVQARISESKGIGVEYSSMDNTVSSRVRAILLTPFEAVQSISSR